MFTTEGAASLYIRMFISSSAVREKDLYGAASMAMARRMNTERSFLISTYCI